MQITKNFNTVTDRLSCPCCQSFVPFMPFLDRIQIIRDLMGVPFNLDQRGGGMYRCKEYQMREHPNYPNSQHTLGRAIDISKHGWSGAQERDFIKWAIAFDLSIIDYKSWFHVDMREGLPIFRHSD